MRLRCRSAGLLLVVLLAGCATLPDREASRSIAYTVADDGSLAARYAPVIITNYPGPSYNRLGKPAASLDERGDERIFVDPEQPAMYYQQREFDSGDAGYTNLIYRLHFERVPFSLVPFHLTAGDNSGLLIVVTLDERDRPVLVTTVHTCGCYLGFVPTSYLPREARPEQWNENEQIVFGVTLPGLLEYPARFDDDYRPRITVGHGTHRVRDIGVVQITGLAENYQVEFAELLPVDTLMRLALDSGETTSFYHESGYRKGYVKGATKPWEFLLMSWWSLDLMVGVDKKYGPRDQTGTVFYTSLKPWDRSESDMWRFAEFLDYWGWKLGAADSK